MNRSKTARLTMRATALAFAIGALAGCAPARLDLLSPADEGDAAAPNDAANDAAASADTGTATQVDYCSGKGAPVLVVDHDAGPTAICAGGVAQAAFRYALCTCEGLVTASTLTTDSFDATLGPYDASKAGAGGSIGTNGSFNANGPLAIGGGVWASDSTTFTTSKDTVAKGELHVNGRVSSGTLLAIGADAFVNGDILATGDLTIAGTLHQPSGATASAGGKKSVGATATGSVNVQTACDCDAALRVDVAAFVESHRNANDDAAGGIDPRALENVNADLTFAVPCGRVFFTRVGGTGNIHLTLASGRTAIFIGGDLAPNGDFTIDVGPSSELDLFVENNVVAAGAFMVGSASNPANARLYVGGNGTINLAKATTLAGNLYGPAAELVLAGNMTVFGSIFTRRVSTQGALTIHYDESVLNKGSGCPPRPNACSSCHDCGNQACNAGACGACTTSSDCCAPLQCQGGTCVAQIK